MKFKFYLTKSEVEYLRILAAETMDKPWPRHLSQNTKAYRSIWNDISEKMIKRFAGINNMVEPKKGFKMDMKYHEIYVLNHYIASIATSMSEDIEGDVNVPHELSVLNLITLKLDPILLK